MDLLNARDAVLREHKSAEKYDPYHQSLAAAGDRISERPVAFIVDDEVVVVGECVAKVMDGLKAFLSRDAEYADRAGREPVVAQALAKARKLTEAAPTEIRVSQQTWNSLLFALGEVGVKVALSDGTFSPYED